MTPFWLLIVCQFSVVAYGLVAGVFLTFSDFVMRSLAGVRTAAGIEAMQVINRQVYRSVFIVLLLGMSALSPLLIVYATLRLSGPAATLIVAGGTLYLAGVFAVSLVANVPMNKRLDAEDPASSSAADYWNDTYLPRWTRWNTIRAAASAGSAACLLLAGVWLTPGQ